MSIGTANAILSLTSERLLLGDMSTDSRITSVTSDFVVAQVKLTKINRQRLLELIFSDLYGGRKHTQLVVP